MPDPTDEELYNSAMDCLAELGRRHGWDGDEAALPPFPDSIPTPPVVMPPPTKMFKG